MFARHLIFHPYLILKAADGIHLLYDRGLCLLIHFTGHAWILTQDICQIMPNRLIGNDTWSITVWCWSYSIICVKQCWYKSCWPTLDTLGPLGHVSVRPPIQTYELSCCWAGWSVGNRDLKITHVPWRVCACECVHIDSMYVCWRVLAHKDYTGAFYCL